MAESKPTTKPKSDDTKTTSTSSSSGDSKQPAVKAAAKPKLSDKELASLEAAVENSKTS